MGVEREKACPECHPSGSKGARGGGGVDTRTEFECSNEEKEEGELSLAPMSPPCVTLPLFSDIAGRQVGIMVSERWPK
jgi:hypothetical protein